MIDFVLGLFGGGGIYGILAAVGGVIAAGFVFVSKIKGGVKRKAKIDDFERAIEIGDKANEARINSNADERTGDDRLREHGKLRD